MPASTLAEPVSLTFHSHFNLGFPSPLNWGWTSLVQPLPVEGGAFQADFSRFSTA